MVDNKKVTFDEPEKPEEEPEELEGSEEMEEPEDSDLEIDDEGEDMDIDMDMGVDLGAVLATEDGDTICTALLDINEQIGEVARQISLTNKILVKLMSKMG